MATRFAPSPTGRLHLGHAFSAVLGHSSGREQGCRFLLRIDDLDQTRSRPDFVDAIIEDLHWLGLEWDEPPLIQSRRGAAYAEALERLRAQGFVYPCFCTRADIAAALEAPHEPSAVYPGTCRNLPDDPERRASASHSWRLDSAKALAAAGLLTWTEVSGRDFHSTRDDFDDVILARKDAPAAYHLACVVDDAASGVTLVTRAVDLRPSAPVQRLLQVLLGIPEPTYFHHPLVAHADGRRLAKRDLAPTLAAMREEGVDGRALAADLLRRKLPLGFAFLDA
ncbi:MAG TPA: tRNA glutamyl-Q(34) synthetase GluQRS [Sphingomicrobium sp.]|nr:tRNA glutamyl-Q(34) synthetase GluQRS [Sphingomicrobium sp.]